MTASLFDITFYVLLYGLNLCYGVHVLSANFTFATGSLRLPIVSLPKDILSFPSFNMRATYPCHF